MKLWEILVPTEMKHPDIREGDRNWPIPVRYHRVWDKKVRAITGGLTILKPAVGHWISPEQELFVERMIPVRICCTDGQIEQIADITASYYRQEAVMYYCVSQQAVIKHYNEGS